MSGPTTTVIFEAVSKHVILVNSRELECVFDSWRQSSLDSPLVLRRFLVCTCAAPAPENMTTSELEGEADAIFEGKVESFELRWKLKEAQIGDVIPTEATDLDQDGTVMQVSF